MSLLCILCVHYVASKSLYVSLAVKHSYGTEYEIWAGFEPVATVALWTQKPFTLLLMRPQGSQGCQKIRFFFTNKTVEFLR